MIVYNSIETDAEGQTNINLARKLALAPGQTAPAADEWGTIAAWAWGISRVVDYLETDQAVDAKRVAITGVSRLGKTVLWAGANDPRIALVIASCSRRRRRGPGPAQLWRNDRSPGRTQAVIPINSPAITPSMPRTPDTLAVDTHCLIALMAPGPCCSKPATRTTGPIPKANFSRPSPPGRSLSSRKERPGHG